MSEAGGRWAVSIVGQADVDPRTLTPHPLNPKVHPPEQDAVVEASLRQLGWLKRVMVNRTTGHILDGHERVALAIRRNEPRVPVDYVEVPAALEGAALLTLDASAALARTHLERWVAVSQQARQATREPALLGFWAQLAKQQGVAGEPDGEPDARRASWAEQREGKEAEVAAQAEALRDEWGVQPGQLWQVGRHQVACGDSLDAAVRARLIGLEPVDLVVTSPPYAVAKGYEQGDGVAGQRAMIRGLGLACQQVVRPGGFVVVNFGSVWAQVMAAAWTGSARACIYPMELEYWHDYHDVLGWDLYAQRIWYKPFAKLRQPLWTYHTSLAHQQEWEHVWTWRLPGGGGEQVYDWDVSVRGVWDSAKEWVDPDGGGPWDHWSAGFPQFVPRQVLRAHSARDAVVWEPFLGAGTTLLACEDLGRRCLGSDKDPGAIAATLQRYYGATGTRPQRVA